MHGQWHTVRVSSQLGISLQSVPEDQPLAHTKWRHHNLFLRTRLQTKPQRQPPVFTWGTVFSLELQEQPPILEYLRASLNSPYKRTSLLSKPEGQPQVYTWGTSLQSTPERQPQSTTRRPASLASWLYLGTSEVSFQTKPEGQYSAYKAEDNPPFPSVLECLPPI